MSTTYSVNGDARDWQDMSVAELLTLDGVDADAGIAVALNDDVVPRADWNKTRLRPDDRIEIVRVVRGG